MSIKVLIADDEEHVRIELEHIISRSKEFEILSLATNGTEALRLLTELKPDVVFLDIDMPGLNGIEVGNIVKEMKNPPFIVYVTAYEQYALDAFKVNAIGYILKPISSKAVLNKLDLIKQYILKPAQEKNSSLDAKVHFNDRLSYKKDDRYVFFEQKDIILAYAKERSVYLRVKGTDYLYNNSLSSLANKLNKNYFFKCHRNYIINILEIQEVISWFNGTYLLDMNHSDGLNVIVSRNKVKDFKKLINL